jgi:hypothetical protein
VPSPCLPRIRRAYAAPATSSSAWRTARASLVVIAASFTPRSDAACRATLAGLEASRLQTSFATASSSSSIRFLLGQGGPGDELERLLRGSSLLAHRLSANSAGQARRARIRPRCAVGRIARSDPRRQHRRDERSVPCSFVFRRRADPCDPNASSIEVRTSEGRSKSGAADRSKQQPWKRKFAARDIGSGAAP